MYEKSARYYDAIYDGIKDYARDAVRIAEIVDSRLPGARNVLDVACGTGRHIAMFGGRFEEVVGLENDHSMLEIARERNPGRVVHEADMTDFNLWRTFDVITCLFSSIGYAGDEGGLRRTLTNLARHVRPGGLVIVEPWFAPDDWEVGRVGLETATGPDYTLARMNSSQRSGDRSVIEFHYLVGRKDGVEHFTEHLELGLFTATQYRTAFEAAGLTVDFDPVGLMGRGLYVGTLPG